MLVSATLKLGRGEFMPIVLGSALMFVLHRLSKGKLTLSSISIFAATFVALIAASFIGFSMLRGFVDTKGLIGDLLGYTIASYNRLAAILSGRMHYPFAGRGTYISSFVAFNDTFNQLFGVSRYLGWPDFFSWWQSEFNTVSSAGLDGQLIWSGTFGYIFSDLGWLSPGLLFLYGVTTGWVWRSMKLGKAVGIVLYPWFAFCILFWFGTNFLLGTQLVVLWLDGILLAFYELLLVRGPKEAS
jgi:hypothetical protein